MISGSRLREGYYHKTRPEILARIPHWARMVLDVGCGAGMLGKALKERNPEVVVHGVEILPQVAAKAEQVLDKVIVGNIEKLSLEPPPGGFDVIVLADVLEHLTDPWKVVEKLVFLLSRRGLMVVSLPNLRNFTEIKSIFDGSWQYGSEGIFDQDHLRFFTAATARKMLEEAGLKVCETAFVPDVRFTFPPNPSRLPRSIKLGRLAMQHVSDRELMELSALQIILVAQRAVWYRSPDEPEVSIIIVNWNGLVHLERCLNSIRTNSGNRISYEVIVVDNGSTDGSQEFLKKLPWVRLLPLERNLGFGPAANLGAEMARGKYLVFLNNDTEPQPGWLEALLEAADPPQVGAVGAMLLYPDGRLQEAGGIVFRDGSAWNYGRGYAPDLPEFNERRDVDYCSAAALLVKAEAFWAAGAFDPLYAPAYYEDADLCFSLRARGWRVVFEPRARVIHLEGATAGRDLSSGFKRYQVINREKFYQKWRQELSRQWPPLPEVVSLAAWRVPPLRILIVEHVPPVYDRASGSQRLLQLIQLMLEEGHIVGFFCCFSWRMDDYLGMLRGMGVDAAYGADWPVGNAGQQEEIKRKLLGFALDFEPDVVWFHTYQMAEAFMEPLRALLPEARMVTDCCDLHFLREKRMAEINSIAASGCDWRDTQRRELAVYAKSDVVIAITREEKELLEALVRSTPVVVIPNIHEPWPQTPGFAERSGLLFVGNFFHAPNVDAVHWFLDEVWPLLMASDPSLTFTVVGNAPPSSLKSRAQTAPGNVVVTGYVPEIEPYLRSARVAVVPLRYGAGMKGKIGEVLAAGLPVVTTSVGAEGMGLENEVHALIADTPEAFASAVQRLYQDRALWEKLSQNGKTYVQAHYSFDKVRFDLRKALLQTLRVSPKLSERVEENTYLLHQRANRLYENKIDKQVCCFSPQKELVSVVMPVYGEVEPTRVSIDALLKFTHRPLEVILVDNSGRQEMEEFLEGVSAKHQGKVKVVRPGENVGYTLGCNLGLAMAEGDYLVVMNNDVVVSPYWASYLLAAFAADPRLGIVGPCTNYAAGFQGSNLSPPDLISFPDWAGRWHQERAGKLTIVNRLIGFLWMMRRELLEEIGGFDPLFGTGNYEDDDYCLRAQLAGYRLALAEDVYVYHYGSHSFRKQPGSYMRLLKTNRLLFQGKWELEFKDGSYNPEEVLRRAWSREELFVPLDFSAIFSPQVKPLDLGGGNKPIRFLCIPDPSDEEDSWLKLAKEFLTSPVASREASLIIWVEPPLKSWLVEVLSRLQYVARREGIDLEEAQADIVIEARRLPSCQRGRVYRAATHFVSLPGVRRAATLREARACGLEILELEEALRRLKGWKA
ncbi:glycosyl transferase family 2 [Ammonifex degensii KC4]|uniref:Glycosyl transferase family 2 n=1 Tax=Ammonifex degensii (strain DSM 10501 / KC4) TaxID=429009 RepID=C9RAZ9_AMMDK|nr:glycosyltransferase [Ammonifex degensii]ACX51426.1 glycosyl transferase family 2 [Ammonifex degensii KC4]